MSQVPFTSFYLGPVAVYTSPTGLQDPITGLSEKGGNFNVGDYCDVTEAEAQQWNAAYGTLLHQGRYRIVKLSTAATTGNTGLGKPLGWALGNTVAQVAISVAGSGATSDGTYTVTSTASGGSVKATAQVVVSGGIMISAKLLNPGFGFTSVPTFGLTEIAGLAGPALLTGGESLLARATQAGVLEAGGKAIADKLGIVAGESLASKIGAGAAKTAIDQMLFAGSDETSRMILQDPSQTAESAISNIGLASVLGGALGTVSPLWSAAMGNKAARIIEDFKSRINEHVTNPNPVSSMTDELHQYYNNVKGMADEVYGAAGLKAQDVEKALPVIIQEFSTRISELLPNQTSFFEIFEKFRFYFEAQK